MKIKEFIVIDLAENAYFQMHKMLRENKLLENNNNYIFYSNFTDQEKSNLKNLIPLQKYYPLYLNSTPVAEHILGEYTSENITYKASLDNKEIFEDDKGKIWKFPQDKYFGDGRIDFFPFVTVIERDQFISLLKLKFNGWTIKITEVKV